jgi:NAD(P)-dependent dehydrogenase (short-subunit alcohol dehydrogenase family)
MCSRRFGRIVFIGSIYGIEPEPTSVLQSVLRRGLVGLTKCLAYDYGAHNVTVNVICPGFFESPLVDELAKKKAAGDQVAANSVLSEWRSIASAKRMGHLSELGALANFLASEEAGFITGQYHVIDGNTIRCI